MGICFILTRVKSASSKVTFRLAKVANKKAPTRLRQCLAPTILIHEKKARIFSKIVNGKYRRSHSHQNEIFFPITISGKKNRRNPQSFPVQAEYRPGDPERRIPLDNADAKFGETHFRLFLRVEDRWRSDAQFPCCFDLRFSRFFPEFLCQCCQFCFFQHAFCFHHAK
jgi:hypothetical protein